MTTPLTGDAVFLAAMRKSGTTLVTGTDRFCVAQAAFEVQGVGNCKTRGLSEIGFARTDTKGVSGYVARIGPLGLPKK
jgi:uncharacterized membrane protein